MMTRPVRTEWGGAQLLSDQRRGCVHFDLLECQTELIRGNESMNSLTEGFVSATAMR